LETFEESKKVVPLTSPTIRPGLPVWLFLGQICNFGLFSTPLAFFLFEKRPNEIWLFWPFWRIRLFMSFWHVLRRFWQISGH